MNRIIMVSREFGSGGREFGRRLSEELGIAYYDHEIISEIAKRTSLSEKYVQDIVEHNPIRSFPITIGRSFYLSPDPVFEQSISVYQKQTEIIEEMASKSDCVIVGRCADYILKEQTPFRIFIYADIKSRIPRCRERDSPNVLSDKEIKENITLIDKKRGKYYRDYTGRQWGDRLNYDLCINTTYTSIKEMVPVIAKLFYAV